jgi:cobaltochelatase CobT
MQAQSVAVVRDSIDKIVGMLTERKIKVTQRGVTAHVTYDRSGNPVTVNIPYLPDDASEQFVRSVQGFLDHEVGHVLFTEGGAFEKAMKGNGMSKADQKKLFGLLNIIEDVRIEKKMAERFPGSRRNLSEMVDFFLRSMVLPSMQQQEAAGDIESTMGNVIMIAARKWGGQTAVEDVVRENPSLGERIDQLADIIGEDLVKRIGSAKSTADAIDIAQGVFARMKSAATAPPPPPPSEQPPSSGNDAAKNGDPSEDENEEQGKGQGQGQGGQDQEQERGDQDQEQGQGEQPQDQEQGQGDPQEEPGEGAQPGDPQDADEESDDSETSSGGQGQNQDPGEAESDATNAPEAVQQDDDDSGADSAAQAGGEQSSSDDDDGDGSSSGQAAVDGDDAGDGDPGQNESTDRTREEAQNALDALDSIKSTDDAVSQFLTGQAQKGADNADYLVFTTEFDKLQDGVPASSEQSISHMVDMVDHMVGPMQRKLERALLSRERRGWSHNMRKGKLSSNALFRAKLNDDRLFKRRYEVVGKGTVVSLAIDCSGSMLSDGALTVAAQAAYALSQTLARLRISHEIIGFTTGSPSEVMSLVEAEARLTGASVEYSRFDPLVHVMVKPFGPKHDSLATSRIARLTEGYAVSSDGIGQCNIDGESIAFIGHRLLQQPAERRVLLVLSDGQPAGHYARGLREHLKRVVEELEAFGVETVGIGINSAAVQDYYSKSIVLRNIDALPVAVMKQLEEVLLAP